MRLILEHAAPHPPRARTTRTTAPPGHGGRRRARRHLARALAALTTSALVATLVGAVVAPASAATTRYEAEAAALSGGAVVSTEHAGYTGNGFVGGYTDGNKGAAATTFAVTASAAGTHTLTLRYANGTTAPKTLSLVLDGGAPHQVTLPATAGWGAWGTVSTSVELTAGSHSVAYRFASSDSGNVNLDHLDVTPASPGSGPGTGPLFEAEQAALAGGAVVSTEHAGYTGSGFVGGFTDANRGSATVTFAVATPSAGSYDLALGYANGTGSPRTFSVRVDGGATQQVTLAPTSGWATWGTVTTRVTLAAGNHTISYSYGTADNGNANLDSLTVTAAETDPEEPEPPAGGPGEAESAYLAGGATSSTAIAGYAGTGYATGFTATGARVVRTLAAASAGAQTLTVRFANTSGSARTLGLVVNGRSEGTIALPSGSGWRTANAQVPLRAGVNTVALRATTSGADVAVDSLVTTGETALAARGATTPYTQYEAEAGSTNGTVLAASRTYGTVQAESSGRRAVRLDATGEHISITLTKPASGLVLRYSLPDAPAGGGLTSPLGVYANGSKVTDATLTSKHAWVYGEYPFHDDPSLGSPHRYYDELRVPIGDRPAGTVIMLRKDTATVPYIDVDLVEAEVVPAALTAPAGAVSITSHGATSGGGDDTAAIRAAVVAARSAGVPVWIPAGTFHVNDAVQVQGVTVLGAGPWHSVLQGTGSKGGFYGTGGGVTIADLAIFGDATVRDDASSQAAIEGDFANDTLIQNVWVQHTKVALWVRPGSTDVLAVGLRVRDTYADGVNFRTNVSNSRVVQSTFRNTGDDSLAMWSDGGPVTNCVFAFNTVQAPALANGLAVYGGTGNRVEDNVVADTVNAAAGIAISTRFGVPFSGTTTVQRNSLVRTGSREPNWPAELGALWIYADVHAIDAPIVVRDVEIVDSTYAGVLMSWQKSIQQVSLDRVSITGSGTYGIEIHATGSASFANTTVSGSGSGGLLNDMGFTLDRGSGNSGF
ncbi:carbohydrate-binding protein [Cellulosimicrobium cellulans]|uniref:carbohydrate-binding protein n=1 Tax=Cellulosimicrobium cellulans TaxID=1710 RepID=UPI00382E3E0A